jgi:serine protease AprX
MDRARSDARFVVVVGLLLAVLVASAPPSAASAPLVEDGQAVVVGGGSLQAATAAVVAAGGVVDRELAIIGGVAARVPNDGLASLQARSDLEVTLDTPVELTASDVTATDADAPVGDGHLASMNLGDGWSSEVGAGVGVALIDTGVIETPALAGRVVHGPDYSDEGDGVDRYGHGTFMAGLIAGDGDALDGVDGVAPGAHIVSLKLAGRDGVTSLSKVLDAIGWVVVNRDEHGIRVLNLSIGVRTDRAPQADPLSAAVQAAWASGITVVAASGNEGTGVVTSPGRDPYVITVAATDTNGTADTSDDTVPDWAGSGRVGRHHKAELAAPGAGVVSLRAPGSAIDEAFPQARLGDDLFRGSGTSMSTALVSGAVAALAEFRPHATPDDLKGALVSTGAPIEGVAPRAIDVAAADAAEADPAWRQDHPIAAGLARELRKGMPWSQTSSPAAAQTWQRMSWAEDGWQRMSGADTGFARMSWARMSWAESGFSRMSWAEANLARMSWADARFTRMSWARMSWARMSWAGDQWTRDRSWDTVGWEAATWGEPSGS